MVKAEESKKTEFVCSLPEKVDFRDLKDPDDALWSNVRSYCRVIQDECIIKKYSNLDIDLVSAVMMQESKGIPGSINTKSGATGLMQIMPDYTIPGRPSTSALLDPTYNIQYGCGILSNYINEYGSVEEGLHAYGGMLGTLEQYAYIVEKVRDDIIAAY